MDNSSLDWHRLRPLEGSLPKAFEELCAQLAASETENIPPGSRFERKGSPDAGIECYWEAPSGDIIAWQAKFFRETPTAGQWKDLDKSFAKALEKHRQLTRYIICLPIDRPDPKIEGAQSFMDRWKTHVEKWKQRARQTGRQVDFEYWGQSELLKRLALEKHHGRHLFWFSRELFTTEWFKNRLDIAIADAGPRYFPTINVDLPVRECFRGLGRTPDLYDHMDRRRGEIRRALNDFRYSKLEGEHGDLFEKLRNAVVHIGDDLALVQTSPPAPIPISGLKALTQEALRTLGEIGRATRDNTKSSATVTDTGRSSDSDLHYLYKLKDVLEDLYDWLNSSDALLANVPALLLVGDAGVGKTHLLCDVARKREALSQPSILLLGQQFLVDEPWTQCLTFLGLSCSVDILLGALNSVGQSRGVRVLFLIDALNEGEGVNIWNKHLAGMLARIAAYPWIGFGASVRGTYEDQIVPSGLEPDKLIRVRHVGFTGFEIEAVARFFAHYSIATPTIPLIRPEFSNPLFLRLFCESIHNRGLSHVPTGVDHLTAVFDFFLDSVNDKLTRELDLDKHAHLVHRAVEVLAQLMATTGQRWIERAVAVQKLNELHATQSFDKSLLRRLLSEGVLSDDHFYTANGTVDGIRFSYDRFTDHQIVAYYLREVKRDSPNISFFPGTPIGDLIRNQSWENSGLIEALAIQVPERLGKELPHLIPISYPIAKVAAISDKRYWRALFGAITTRSPKGRWRTSIHTC